MTVFDNVDVGGLQAAKREDGVSYPDGHGIASRKGLAWT